LKTARGRITYAPRMMEFFSVLGPISRSVADAAALLDVMAGPAPGDFFWAPPPARPFLEEVGAPPDRLRVAVADHTDDPTIAVAPANAAAAREAGELLASMGHHVEAVDPPGMSSELLP